MKKAKILFIAIFLVLSSSLLIGCMNDDDISNNYGKLSIKITDAPMDYNQFMEVSITIDKIEIRKVNKNKEDEIIVLADEPFTTNMLNLVNGITETLADTKLPVGDYDLIRLYFSSTKMILKNGKNYSSNMDYDDHDTYNNWSGGMMNGGMMNGGMMMDGMMMNGDNNSMDIHLNPYLHIGNGMDETYLLDLDISQSFQCNDVQYGNMGSGNWMDMSGYSFAPVMRFVNLSETGTVEGTVRSDSTDMKEVTVYLMQGSEIYTTTHTDQNGNYRFIGIPKGTYNVIVEMDGYMMDTNQGSNNVGMTPGSLTTVNCFMIPTND